MKKAFLRRIDEYTIADFDIPASEYLDLLDACNNKTPITILGVGCEVDGVFEHDYHDIQLADGTKYAAISGYHLELIA